MGEDTFLRRPARAAEGPRAWARRAFVALAALLGAAEVAGGAGLAWRPDGSLLGMPVSLLRGAFPDFLVPGSLLLGLGVLSLAAALGALRGWRAGWVLAGAATAGALVWILVETLLVGYVSWLQPAVAAWALAAGLLALPLAPRRT